MILLCVVAQSDDAPVGSKAPSMPKAKEAAPKKPADAPKKPAAAARKPAAPRKKATGTTTFCSVTRLLSGMCSGTYHMF